MCRSSGPVLFLALFLLPWSAAVLDSQSIEISQESYQRLRQISTQLYENNERLREALENSELDLKELRTLYREARNELQRLRGDLEKVRSELKASQGISATLRKQLQRTGDSLLSLEQSLKELRRRMWIERGLWILGIFGAFLIGASM